MKYINASDILPDKLLKEIQKYISGKALYIPADKVRKQWGSGSGAKAFYQQRNDEIKLKYLHNATIGQLAEEYCLSEETVRKILFK